jgi:hypothetical protein
MAKQKMPATESVTVRNLLTIAPDSERARDLFAAILRSVRSATARREQRREDEEREQKRGHKPAA